MKYVQWTCQDCSTWGGGIDNTSAQKHADDNDHAVMVETRIVEMVVKVHERRA